MVKPGEFARSDRGDLRRCGRVGDRHPGGCRGAACLYPGMRPYSADDADHFQGRGVEIEELLGRLWAGEREIYVSGRARQVVARHGGVAAAARPGASGLGGLSSD
jgi:hypothetical protein